MPLQSQRLSEKNGDLRRIVDPKFHRFLFAGLIPFGHEVTSRTSLDRVATLGPGCVPESYTVLRVVRQRKRLLWFGDSRDVYWWVLERWLPLS